MPEYELRLRFTAADGRQASRLAEAWADTCAAEFGTRYAGFAAIEEAVHDWRFHEPGGEGYCHRCGIGRGGIPGMATLPPCSSAPNKSPTVPGSPAGHGHPRSVLGASSGPAPSADSGEEKPRRTLADDVNDGLYDEPHP